MDAMGYFHRKLADLLVVPPLPKIREFTRPRLATEASSKEFRFFRGHKLSVTAIVVSPDEEFVFAASKDGAIVRHQLKTGQRHRLHFSSEAGSTGAQGTVLKSGPEWVQKSSRRSNVASTLALSISSDGRYLAAGGGDAMVHIFDPQTGEHLKAFPGHKDAITGLVFREGTHELFSASLDRCIKIWSLEEMAYIDTLFGHQAEVLGLDALRAERIVSCGADRTCRVWKIPEESQLVFRGHCLTIESCAYIAGGEWVTGSADGSVSLWNSMKKKPIWTAKNAHSDDSMKSLSRSESSERAMNGTLSVADIHSEPLAENGPTKKSHVEIDADDGDDCRKAVDVDVVDEDAEGAGSVGGDVASWVTSIAVCRGTDTIASGAGNGIIKLWKVIETAPNGRKAMECIGGFAVRGFVNSLQFSRTGRLLVVGVGQEPRMGRWAKDAKARNGVIVIPLHQKNEVIEEKEDESGDEDGDRTSSEDITEFLSESDSDGSRSQ